MGSLPPPFSVAISSDLFYPSLSVEDSVSDRIYPNRLHSQPLLPSKRLADGCSLERSCLHWMSPLPQRPHPSSQAELSSWDTSMAEGSFRMESESYNAEDMDEGGDEVGEEEMVEGNEYEEFGAFGGYGTFTSFDIHLLRAFGSLGPGLHILAVRLLLGHLLALPKLGGEGRFYAGGGGGR